MLTKTVKERATEIGKNYKCPHILVRWVMLYYEVNKILPFVEVLKGNLENKLEYIPFLKILCEQTLDEIKRTSKNLKYLSETEAIYKLICETDFDIENKKTEITISTNVILLKTKLFKLILTEKKNFSIDLFNLWEEDISKKYLDLYFLISSQKEILPL